MDINTTQIVVLQCLIKYNMRIYEVLGLSRSGHHAMINWLIKNLCGYESDMKWKLSLMPNDLIYINEGNLDVEMTLKYVRDHKDTAKAIIFSYENSDVNFSVLNNDKKYVSPLSLNYQFLPKYVDSKRIVFIRDFYNNLASRIESNNKQMTKFRGGNVFQWDVRKNYIESWKTFAKHILDKKADYLKYEDWMTSKEIRSEFMKKITGYGEQFDNKVRGTDSSFGHDKLVLNRIDQVEVADDIKVLVNSDLELEDLIVKLGYIPRKLV